MVKHVYKKIKMVCKSANHIEKRMSKNFKFFTSKPGGIHKSSTLATALKLSNLAIAHI